MTETQNGSETQALSKWPVPAFFGALALVIAAFYYWSGADLRACDEKIKETLKAPSTYNRVSSSGTAGIYTVSYDAANSFGAPIRSEGICTVSQGTAIWVPMSQ